MFYTPERAEIKYHQNMVARKACLLLGYIHAMIEIGCADYNDFRNQDTERTYHVDFVPWRIRSQLGLPIRLEAPLKYFDDQYLLMWLFEIISQ